MSLLLPKSERERMKLASDRKRYTLDVVQSREGGYRKALRGQAVSSDLLHALVAICPARTGWKKKQFVDWLVRELATKGSAARNVVIKHAPDLIERTRGHSWWYRLLVAEKMSR